MPRLGPFELVVILVIILVIFGVGRLPEIGGAMGKGIRAFKKGQSGEEEEKEESAKKVKNKTTAKGTAKKD